MLSEVRFAGYAARIGLTKAAVEAIERVRSSAPARRGFSQHRNVSGRFASRKMGFTLGYSAKSTEAMGLLAYELDEDVLEFWEEPGIELRFEYQDAAGKPRAGRFHPDALVLERSGAFIDEWKTEEQLLRDGERMPGRYLNEPGGWRSPSAEASAARLGLTFRLRTPASLPAAVELNGRFLRDYYANPRAVPADLIPRIVGEVTEHAGITLDQLLGRLPEVSADDVFASMVSGDIYVDLARHRLADTFYVPVYPSRGVADSLDGIRAEAPASVNTPVRYVAGEVLRWNDALWTVVGVSTQQVTLRSIDGALLPLQLQEARLLAESGSIRLAAEAADDRRDRLATILRSASPRALRLAEERHAALRTWQSGGVVEASRRSLQRWQAAFRRAEKRFGFGFVGLLEGRRGRRSERSLDPAIEAIIAREIAGFYETPDAPNKRALFGRVRNACFAEGLEPPSYRTVCRRIDDRDAQRADERRRGRKAAYPTSAPIWYLASDTPIHGERPWELAHIDHTQLDLEVVDSESGIPLGRPWLTLMIDAYTRRILAYWLTFDPPSRWSLMMVVRRCVTRCHRLPDRFVVDGGTEFGSTYFEQMLAMFGIELSVRPGQPRFGAVIERFFGATNTRLVHALAGNTKPTKDVRSMSRDMNPTKRAVWTLASLLPVFDEFLFDVYDLIPHPALGTSPRQFDELRAAQTGLRDVRFIADDEAFLLATLPTTRKGTARVDRQKGVKINRLHYSAPELRSPGIAGSDVPVRFDPMDIRHAFAFVRGHWIECWCASLRRFPPTSDRAVRAAISSELFERGRAHGRTAAATSSAIAHLLASAKGTESVRRQARSDAELRTAVGPVDPAPAGEIEATQEDTTPIWPLEVYESYA